MEWWEVHEVQGASELAENLAKAVARGVADGIVDLSRCDRGCQVGGLVWNPEVAMNGSNCAR